MIDEAPCIKERENDEGRITEYYRRNRFSSLTCRTGDEIGDLVQEIYHDGIIAGYELAISRLQMLNRMPFKMSEDYMEIQGGRIKRILNAIYEQRENN